MIFPEQLARAFVVGVETLVHGRADEDQSAGRDQGTAYVEGAGGGFAALFQFGIGAQRDLPTNLTSVQVNGTERPPGPFVGRVPIGVAKFTVSGGHVGDLIDPAHLQLAEFYLPVTSLLEEEGQDRLFLHLRKTREGGHLTATGLHQLSDLVL